MKTTKEEVTSTSAPAPAAEEAVASSAPAPEKSETQPKQEISAEEEKKIVESVLKQLTPFVEQLVSAEVQRALSGQPDFDVNNGFPGFQGGASFPPPEILMSMMNDFTRGGFVGDINAFPPNFSPQGPTGAPSGVGGSFRVSFT